jgi:hypothetical protein
VERFVQVNFNGDDRRCGDRFVPRLDYHI